MSAWPCSACGQPGARNVGTDGYCPRHLAELYGRFDPAVFELDGRGWPGRTDDDADLTCSACGATWTGVAGDLCRWCVARREHLRVYSAEMLLRPPEVDVSDDKYEARMRAWAGRMKHAVDAELITRESAQAAWRRTVSRDAA
jgi:hypothetical protein